MNWLLPLNSIAELDEVIALKSARPDIIIGPKITSRYSTLEISDCEELAKKAKASGLNVFLQWDTLMTESVFSFVTSALSKLDMSLFSGIRVQDPGALLYIVENFKELPVHLILETGNHNIVGLNKWLELGRECIKRIVLSAELSFEIISEFSLKLPSNIELEVQALGRLLLFYTPRKLLSPLEKQKVQDQHIEALGTSEESPHKGFPLIENKHGTFMFNTKDLFILDETKKLNALASSRSFFFRSEFASLSVSQTASYFANPCDELAITLRAGYPKTVIKGFFKVNKTDVLFKKLKNSRIQNRHDNLLGEVVDVKKKKHVGIFLKEGKDVSVGDYVTFHTPEGKEKSYTLSEIKNATGTSILKAKPGQVIFLPPIGGVSVRTLVLSSS